MPVTGPKTRNITRCLQLAEKADPAAAETARDEVTKLVRVWRDAQIAPPVPPRRPGLLVEIRIGNDGMRTPDQIADALKTVEQAVRAGRGTGRIRDVNGNTVGGWDIETKG